MNAVVMDNAVIGEGAFVAACSFVKAGMVVPPRSLVAGTPARLIRELSDGELAWKTAGTRIYQQLARRCQATMVETDALSTMEDGRKRIEPIDIKPLAEVKASL